jgi:hypothetical protein
MLSWRSHSLAVLALAAGALSPCAMPPSARAGDKIEFSAPGASLEIPQVVRDDKEPPKPEMQTSMQAADMVPEGIQDSSEIVIISTPKEEDARTWDSAFTDNRDNNANAGIRYDNLDSRQRPINGATNWWDMPGGWNLDAGSIFSERGSDEAASRDGLRGRLEAVTTAGRTDYRKEELYGRHSSDSDEDSAWSRSFPHHGSPGLERMRDGQFVPVYEEVSTWYHGVLHSRPASVDRTRESQFYAQMKANNEQSSHGYSPERLSSVADNQPRGSSLSPDAEYISERNAARARTLEETMSAPRTIHFAETNAVSQHPDIFARPDPPASPPGQVQSRPAVLPFPKKPGSVFQ